MRQSTYGDGTLYLRKDGRWEYRVVVGHKSDGDPEFKSFYSRDKTGRKAKEKYREWQRERDEAKIDVDQTVKTWATTWLETYKKGRGTSGGNYKNYKTYVEKHIIPRIGSLMMRDVRQAHIQQIYRDEAALSNSALNYIKICLHGIFRSGIKNHLCLEDPTEDTCPVWHPKNDPEYFSRDEMERILDFAEKDPDGPLIELLLYTGLRIGEACALMWQDYAEDDGVITIRRTIARTQETGEKYDIKEIPKGKKVRQVVLGPECILLLQTLPKISLWIIAGKRGSYITPDLYRRRYYRFFDRLNASLAAAWAKAPHKPEEMPPEVRSLSPHKCRHSYGTYLLAGCHNLRTVQEQLGHSRVGTTEIYTHSSLDIRKEDVLKLKY